MPPFFRRCALAVAILVGVASQADAQTVFFKAPPDAPSGLNVQVLTDQLATVPEDVPAVDGGWEYHVVPKPGAWRNEPVFLINLPERKPDTDGVSSDPMSLELGFSFKVNQSKDRFEVPIVLFKGVGVKERLRIEALRPFQEYERILLAQALALHYIARLHDPHQPPVRYVTKLWFETVYAAIVSEHRPLRVSSGLLQTIGSVFDNDAPSASHFAGATAQVRQLAWRDQADLDPLLEARDCVSAKALIDYLEAYNTDNPDDAGAMRIADAGQVINSMKSRYDAACGIDSPL